MLVGAGEVGHAEVGQLRESGAGRGLGQHHHVRRLHVAVDHPARVRVLQRLAQRLADPGHVAVGQHALAVRASSVAPSTSSDTR